MSDREHETRLTRRKLLLAAGGAAAGAGLASLPGCAPGEEQRTAIAGEDVDAPQLRAYPDLPRARSPLNCSLLAFFDAHEARTVEAFTARIVPGDEDDPGARESCVTHYIDRKLADFAGWATPTYLRPPFAKPADGREPRVEGDTVWIPEKELARYGFQGSQTPQDAYRAGIESLDQYARARFGSEFVALEDAQQDSVIEDLEATDPAQIGKPKNPKPKDPKALDDAFDAPSPFGFFSMLYDDTVEGLFSDPLYGGNRDYAGWKLIGYPGAQRFYDPTELKAGPRNRRVQGLLDMPAMHPGHPDEDVILPIQGTRRTR